MVESNRNQFEVEVGSMQIVRRVLEYQLQPIIRKWSNANLYRNSLFGGLIRYTRGAKLFEHLGKLPKNVFTVILHVSI